MGGQPDREATPPHELLQIDVHADSRRRAVVSLRGELDHVSAPRVRRIVEALASDGRDDIVLDLSALSFMDAGGLNLLFALRDLDADGIVSMVDGSGEAARVLRMLPGSPPLPNAVVPPSASPG